MTPSALPLLTAGAHLVPEDGACLMEYVSVLAGERFSDTPRCTDPLLATLARLVNDATSDDRRQQLAELAPRLTLAARSDAVGSATLVLATLLHIRRATGRLLPLDLHVAAARRRLRRVSADGPAGRLARWLEPVHRSGPGRHRLAAAVGATACLPVDVRDAVLREVLDTALARSVPGGRAAVAAEIVHA